jgi:hypothetical protein
MGIAALSIYVIPLFPTKTKDAIIACDNVMIYPEL